jgi:uncharacterized protein
VTQQDLAGELLSHLEGIGPMAVAFSGGADSALVLAAAVRALGPSAVIACTAVSESVAALELELAREFTASLGVVHLTPRTHELKRAGYIANATDRCYFCKSEVLDVIGTLAGQHGFSVVASGVNADDVADPFRPGIRAGAERGVRTPLAELGFAKDVVRELSRQWGLRTWSKPAAPCLASRIRHGVEVTGYRLARVERAEVALREMLEEHGMRSTNLRVRDLGKGARVEVDSSVAAVCDVDLVAALLAEAGFTGPVSVVEFSSGSLSRDAVSPRH